MKTAHILSGMALGLFLLVMGSCSKEYGFAFENGYNKGGYEDTVSVDIDTDPFKVDHSKYTQARLFPGLMAASEPRLTDFLVQVDLDYEEISSRDLRISVAPGNWQSTGVYAPAGELVTIEVPMGVYGLTAQISPHVATSLDGIAFPRRDARIFSQTVLFPGKNLMRNLYGGLIYILPARPLGRTVDLRFSGVAKAASFKLNGPGATTNQQWKDMLAATTVPWFELEGDRIVFTLETEKAKRFPIDDPALLMQTWDKAIREGFWDWTGMSEGNADIRHRAPFNKWRIVHDVLFKPGVAQVSGYPVRAMNTENYFKQAVTVASVKNSNWGTYHELGHNMQMHSTWSFAGNGEVTNNVFHFGVSWLVFGQQSYKIAEVWNKAVPYIAATKLRDGPMNWANMTADGSPYRSQSDDIRLMMWAQILERYGYDFWTYIYTRAREARFTSAVDQAKVDFFYEALSEFTGMDMAAYLSRGWGLYPSAISRDFVRTKAKPKGNGAADGSGLPPLDKESWNFNPVTKTGGDATIQPLRMAVARTGWNATIGPSTHSSHGTYGLDRLFDGSAAATSFWHIGGTKTFPYHITVTSPNAIKATGFYFQQRPGFPTRHITGFKMEIRPDASSPWEEMAFDVNTLAGMNGLDAATPYYVQFNDGQDRTFREFRFTINGASHPDVALSELGAYQLAP